MQVHEKEGSLYPSIPPPPPSYSEVVSSSPTPEQPAVIQTYPATLYNNDEASEQRFLILLLLAVLFPPVAIYAIRGCSCALIVSIVLWPMGVAPACALALWVLYCEHEEKAVVSGGRAPPQDLV